MLDANWKTWGLLVLIALGISFEVIKKLPGQDYSLADSELIRMNGEAEPFAVRIQNLLLGKSNKQKRRTPRVAGSSDVRHETVQKTSVTNEPTATTFGQEEKPKEEKKEEKKNSTEKEKCDENNPKIDPQTGQPIPCKKKKKKPEEKKEEPAPQAAKNHDKSTEDTLDNLMGSAISTGQLPQPVGQKAETFDTLEEWMQRLLNSPDRAMTKIFIDHHQRSLVTDEIYYRITEMMLSDSRSDMKQLGVLCAGLAPSVPSFQLLAHLVDSERSGSPSRRDAEGFLSHYEDLSKMGIIERILRSPNISHATLLAAQKLDVAVHKQLNSDNPTTPTNPPSATQRNLERAATYFKRFVAVLENLLQTKDPVLNDQAKRTLSQLQTFYSTYQSNTPTPAAPPNSTTAQADQSP